LALPRGLEPLFSPWEGAIHGAPGVEAAPRSTGQNGYADDEL